MADKGGFGSFPWASAAVLVAFVASTQLVPQAFEPLRPAEKARAQAPLDPDLDVNARLWEDPFTALRRYESERAERCERIRKQTSQTLDIDCRERVAEVRDPQRMLAKLDRDHDQRLDNTLVIMGLLPGADFVGAEPARVQPAGGRRACRRCGVWRGQGARTRQAGTRRPRQGQLRRAL